MFPRALESTRQRERNIERARTLTNRGVPYSRDIEWYDRLHPGFTYDYLWKRIQDPIASDPVVQKLHDNGYYRGRPFHISA